VWSGAKTLFQVKNAFWVTLVNFRLFYTTKCFLIVDKMVREKVKDPLSVDANNLCYAYYTSNFCTKKSCLKEWELKKKVGAGLFGTVYDACLNDDCKYVIKIQLLNRKNRRNFDKEILMSKIASQSGLSPEFKDSFVCEIETQEIDENDKDVVREEFTHLGFIISEKYDTSVKRLAKQGIPKKELASYFEKILEIDSKLIDIGIWHHDNNLGNYVLKNLGSNGYKMAAIDFGGDSAFIDASDENLKALLRHYDERTVNLTRSKYDIEQTNNNILKLDDEMRLWLKTIKRTQEYTRKVMDNYYKQQNNNNVEFSMDEEKNKKRKRDDEEQDEDRYISEKKLKSPEQYCFIGTNWCTSGKCIKDIILTNQIHLGSGYNYAACINNQCKYVMKVQLLPKTNEADFQRESFLADLASKNNIGPKFKESYICEANGNDTRFLGIIIVDRWDKGLSEYITQFNHDSQISLKERETVLELISSKLKKLLELGIWMNIYADNVVLKYENNNIIDVAITDYSLAFAVKDGKALSRAKKLFIGFEKTIAKNLHLNSRDLKTIDAEESSFVNYFSSFFRKDDNILPTYPEYVYSSSI
jgi:hypothetical protein